MKFSASKAETRARVQKASLAAGGDRSHPAKWGLLLEKGLGNGMLNRPAAIKD